MRELCKSPRHHFRPQGRGETVPGFFGTNYRGNDGQACTGRLTGGQPMPDQRWTWVAASNPCVPYALAEIATDLEWCDELETAAVDPVDGKVLCVCAAVAIARTVIAVTEAIPDRQAATDALDLLGRWID